MLVVDTSHLRRFASNHRAHLCVSMGGNAFKVGACAIISNDWG